jgi:hypothetical protein
VEKNSTTATRTACALVPAPRSASANAAIDVAIDSANVA